MDDPCNVTVYSQRGEAERSSGFGKSHEWNKARLTACMPKTKSATASIFHRTQTITTIIMSIVRVRRWKRSKAPAPGAANSQFLLLRLLPLE